MRDGFTLWVPVTVAGCGWPWFPWLPGTVAGVIGPVPLVPGMTALLLVLVSLGSWDGGLLRLALASLDSWDGSFLRLILVPSGVPLSLIPSHLEGWAGRRPMKTE